MPGMGLERNSWRRDGTTNPKGKQEGIDHDALPLGVS